MTFQAWLQQAIVARLAESDSPRRDAEILLGHVTGRARTWILAFGETTLSADEAAGAGGAPGCDASAGNSLLIWSGSASFGRCRCSSPRRRRSRPDTECLVEQALARLPTAPVP